MKKNTSEEESKPKSPCELLGLAMIETVLVIIVAMSPTMAEGICGWTNSGSISRFLVALKEFFSHSEGIVLAMSVLGASFVNLLDVGGCKHDEWVRFKKFLWFLLLVAYITAVVGDITLVLGENKCAPVRKCAPTDLVFALMIFSSIILLCSNWWRRHHSEDQMNKPNPFQAESNGFAENFEAYLEK